MVAKKRPVQSESSDDLVHGKIQQNSNGTDRMKATVYPLASNETQLCCEPGFIPPHGGYENLLSYKKSQIVYDATIRFCNRFISIRSRTHDQMVQAARSGNKNIAEGSQLSGTSKELEIKLTNVARASLEELLGDYRDYLRQHGHAQWDKNSKEVRFVRKLATSEDASYESFREFIDTRPADVVANILICLIHMTNYLLDQQIRRLEKDFLEHGGLRERMTRARIEEREKQRREGRNDR